MTPQVKICGLTRLSDARCALESGASALGFVLYPGSRRAIAPDALRQLLAELRSPVPTVGVTVNLDAAANWELQKKCGFDIVQLHGGEPPEVAAQLVRAGSTVWKAFSPVRPSDLDELEIFHQAGVKCFVIDAGAGGSGRRCDWELAAQAARRWRIMLAGGITPDNVTTALDTVRPWGVDCASGVECANGIKDPLLIENLIRKVQTHV